MWPCEKTCDEVLNLIKLYVDSEKHLWLLYFMMNVVDSPRLSDSLQSKLKETLPHGQYPAGT